MLTRALVFHTGPSCVACRAVRRRQHAAPPFATVSGVPGGRQPPHEALCAHHAPAWLRAAHRHPPAFTEHERSRWLPAHQETAGRQPR